MLRLCTTKLDAYRSVAEVALTLLAFGLAWTTVYLLACLVIGT